MSSRAVFLDLSPLEQGDLDLTPLQDAFSELVCHEQSTADQIVERLRGAQVAIVNKVALSADTLAACPDLKLILVSATGVNNIDLQAAGERGRWQESGQFCLLDFPIVELEGKTLGLLGHGELGSAVSRLAEAFGMRVLVGNLPGRPKRPERLDLDELLPQVDALTLHCPLTEQTRNLIGARELQLMKPSAFLINAARGGLVDEQALADALRRGHLGGAATDVLTSEPPSDDNPLLDPSLPRLIITPHSAWGSREARQRIVGQLAENATAFFAGAPIRQVN